jgi:hypothetical protein
MPWIKGLVLLSRFEYLEKKYGTTVYQEFLDTISTADHNFAKQPVDTANLYADDLLVAIDQKLLEVHFKRDLEEFRKLGQWNAQNLMPKYFQLYLSEQKPVDFLDQFSRLREMLIGTGETKINVLDKKTVLVCSITASRFRNAPERAGIWPSVCACAAPKAIDRRIMCQ